MSLPISIEGFCAQCGEAMWVRGYREERVIGSLLWYKTCKEYCSLGCRDAGSVVTALDTRPKPGEFMGVDTAVSRHSLGSTGVILHHTAVQIGRALTPALKATSHAIKQFTYELNKSRILERYRRSAGVGQEHGR